MVGETLAHGGQASAGSVYVFNDVTGALIRKLTSPNAQIQGYFGTQVALSGDLAVVGAPQENANEHLLSCHAYIFNAITAKLLRTLTSPNAQFNGQFGTSVAMSGSGGIVLVGAPWERAGELSCRLYNQAGHAYMFKVKTGALIHTLTSANQQCGGNFGGSVAISGNVAVVGAGNENAYGHQNVGHVYTFNASTGRLMKKLTSPNPNNSGFFGGAVAISSGIILVSASGESVNGTREAGRAYVFSASTDALLHTLTSPDNSSGSFGFSVALNGKIVLVGAPFETVGGDVEAGRTYIFNATTGKLFSTLASPLLRRFGDFGTAVAVSGNIIIVSDAARLVAHVYIF